MLIRDIALHLEANGLGTLNSDLFLADSPEEPGAMVTIYGTGGHPQDEPLSDVRPTVQIRTRADGHEAAEAKAWAVFNLLSIPGKAVIANGRKMIIRPMQPPTFLERDASRRVVFVFNLEIHTTRD